MSTQSTSGDDSIIGGSSNDKLNGGAGDDTLDGGAGHDKLTGGSGEDLLIGGEGNDSLVGGSESDTLVGNAGNDQLNGDSGQDVLVYTLDDSGRGISSDLYTGGSGIDTLRLELSGAQWLDDAVGIRAELARYLAHLATVERDPLSGEIANGSAQDFTFRFGDGSTLKVQMTEQLQVLIDGRLIDLDDPFLAGPQAELPDGVEDQPYTVTLAQLLQGFGDLEGDSLQVTDLSSSHGTLAANADGSYTLTPPADYFGPVTLSYTVSDGAGGELAAQLGFALSEVNDAPTTEPVTLTAIAEDSGARTLTAAELLAEASDIEGDTLSISQLAIASGQGTLTQLSATSWSYTPAADDDSEVSFSYTITDDGTTDGVADPKSVQGSATLDLTPVNDAPTLAALADRVLIDTANDDSFPVQSLQLLAEDIDSSLLNYRLADGTQEAVGSYGTLTVDADTGAVSFTADDAAVEALKTEVQLSFDLEVSDGALSATRTLRVQLQGSNDLATISGPATGEVTEDAALDSASGQLQISDRDAGDAGFAAVAATDLQGEYGSFSFDASSGAWSYTLDNTLAATQGLGATDETTESLTVSSLDGTAQETIVVTVRGAADGPAAAPTVVEAADANDKNFGEAGAEQSAGAALSRITVSGNSERILGTAGADSVDGGAGNDTLYGFGGNDTLLGGAGTDVIYGGLGEDDITGDNNVDAVYGGSGNDTLRGSQGDDSLYGGQGNDALAGGDGIDRLIGGHGADTLSGGAGDDVFVFLTSADTGDTVSDFDAAGNDVLDLSALDANSGLAGKQALSFVSTGMTTSLSAHQVIYFQQGGNTFVQADTDGNTATAEFQIQLTGLKTLSAADFDFVV